MSGSILCWGKWWWIIRKLDMVGCTPVTHTPLWSCCCDSVLWVVVVIQSAVLMASMGWRHLSLCNHIDIHFHCTLSESSPSSVDALEDIHRSHIFPLICPEKSASLTLGDHQTTIFSWCNLTFTLFGSWLNWGGAGTSVPCMADTHHTLYEGRSVTIWCTTSWGSSSLLSLIFLFP